MVQQYISLNLNLLAVFGAWPASVFPAQWHKVAAKLVSLPIMVCFVVQFSLELIDLFITGADLERLTAQLGVIGLHVDCACKFIFLLRQNHKLQVLVNNVAICFEERTAINTSKSASVETWWHRGRKLTCMWPLMCYMGVAHWCVDALRRGTLLFHGWYWGVDEGSVVGYAAVLVLQTCAGVASVMVVTAFDAFVVVLLMLLCDLFRNLGTSLTLAPCTDSRVVTCVRRHQNLLRVVKDLYELLNPVMFVQCTKSMLVVCMVAFEATTVTADLGKIFALVEYFVSAAVQFFVYCWCADELGQMASGLGDALYFSDWETEGVHQKKAVCIVIQRCQKVPKLYGSHFFTLSVQTFVEVIRISFSYYMVLRTLHIAEN